jgi:hypothetical protein
MRDEGKYRRWTATRRAWKESETNHTAYALCFGMGDEDRNGSYHMVRGAGATDAKNDRGL